MSESKWFAHQLHIARSAVRSATQQVQGQISITSESVMNPLRQVVSQVVGGVWKGGGADAFVEEINTIFLPTLQQLVQSVTRMNSHITYAIDVMDRAEQQATGVANQMGETFRNVYR
jgi:hypothetical protein